MTTTPEQPVKIAVELMGLDHDTEAAIWQGLREIGFDPEEHVLIALSQDVPVWIKFLLDGSALATMFGIAATAYLKKIAENLADTHWEHRQEIRKAAENKLSRFISLCRSTGSKLTHITLEFGHEWLRFDLILLDEEKAKLALARFVAGFKRIAKSVDPLRSQASTFRPEITMHEEDNGFTITWHDTSKHSSFRQAYTSGGTPVGKMEQKRFSYGGKPHPWIIADEGQETATQQESNLTKENCL